MLSQASTGPAAVPGQARKPPGALWSAAAGATAAWPAPAGDRLAGAVWGPSPPHLGACAQGAPHAPELWATAAAAGPWRTAAARQSNRCSILKQSSSLYVRIMTLTSLASFTAMHLAVIWCFPLPSLQKRSRGELESKRVMVSPSSQGLEVHITRWPAQVTKPLLCQTTFLRPAT